MAETVQGQSLIDDCTGSTTHAMVLAAATPTRPTSRQHFRPAHRHSVPGAQELEEQSTLKEVRKLEALCSQLQADCSMHQQQRHIAEQRVQSLERQLVDVAASTTSTALNESRSPMSATTATTAVGSTSKPTDMDESPGFVKLRTEAKQACQETAAVWESVEAIVEPQLLRILHKQDAASRAVAQVKLERRARNALWEALQEAADAPTVMAVAQRINNSRRQDSALPVHIARRLFEAAPSTPKQSSRDSGSIGATPRPRGQMQKATLTRPSSVPCSLNLGPNAAFRQTPKNFQAQKEFLQERLSTFETPTRATKPRERGLEAQKEVLKERLTSFDAATPGSARVRDRVKALELSGHRRASFPLG